MKYSDCIKDKIRKLMKKQSLENKKVVLFGATTASKEVKDILMQYDISPYAIIDNGKKAGSQCMGLMVYKPDDLLLPYSDEYFIIICSRFYKEMLLQVQKMGYGNQVYAFYWIENMENTSLSLFCKKVREAIHGRKVYKRIKKLYPGYEVLLAPYTGMGDIYLIGSYLYQYLEKEKIDKYVFVVVTKGCYKTAKLFNIENVHIISEKEAELLIQANMTFGNEQLPLKILNDVMVHTKRTQFLRGYHGLHFGEMFRIGLFNLPKDTPYQFPVWKDMKEYVVEQFRKNGLKPGKTVIIAPYSNTLNDIPSYIMEKIVMKLTELGYTCCTNSSGPTEPVIKGSIGVLFSIEAIKQCCDYAGYFIGVRSGLCDLISQSTCKKIILYEKELYVTNATQYEFFSLNLMKFCDDAIELQYDDCKESYLKLSDKILEAMVS